MKSSEDFFSQRIDEQNIVSKKIAWVAFSVMSALCLFLTITIYHLAPLKRTEVKVLTVDKQTGLPTDITPLASFETNNIKEMSSIESLNKFFIHQYIQAHDSYNYYSIRDAYSTVKLYSTDDVFRDYALKFQPPISIEKQLGDKNNMDILVHSITLENTPTPFEDTENGITAKARIEKRVRSGNQILEKKIGTVIMTFGYNTKLDMDEKSRNNNPLGFTTTSYNFIPDMEQK